MKKVLITNYVAYELFVQSGLNKEEFEKEFSVKEKLEALYNSREDDCVEEIFIYTTAANARFEVTFLTE